MSHPCTSSPQRVGISLRYHLAGGVGIALVLAWWAKPSGCEDARIPTGLAAHVAAGRASVGAASTGSEDVRESDSIQGADFQIERADEFIRTLIADLGADRIETETWRPGVELREFVESVARSDPRAVLQWIESHAGDRFVRHALAELVARIWGETNPSAAWQWAEAESGRGDIEGRPRLYTAVLQGMARSDPDAVVALATDALRKRASDAPADSAAVMRHAVHALLQANETSLVMTAVAAWCEDSPADSSHAEVITTVVHAIASHSPAEALAWLRGLPPAAVQPETIATLATRWAASAPGEALAWAAALPAGTTRDLAVGRAFQVWSRDDEGAALQWLASNAASTASDALLVRLLDRPDFRTEYPEAAVQLAEMIRDNALRGTSLQSAVLAWSNQNPAAAAQYAETARVLSAEQRSRLLASLQHYAEFGFY